MSRPTIHCPACHRELFNLHRPQCLWCGARLSLEQFELVAMPPQLAGPPAPQPMPLLGYGPSQPGMHSFWQRLIPFSAITGSVSPWERKLRIVGAALSVCLVLARLADLLWTLWRTH